MASTPSRAARILSLDGGGAKGFYTLGVLDEIERNVGKPLHQCFELIYGTSTGAIIAALIARGDKVEDILRVYHDHVPTIMKSRNPNRRTAALDKLARSVFGTMKAIDFKTRVGIVATNWKDERPFIFKSSADMAHGAAGSFVSFFGCSVADAVIASCSASPFFHSHVVTTSKGDMVELADGGFCANNPTLYAITDGARALKIDPKDLRVLSVGVGSYGLDDLPGFYAAIGQAFPAVRVATGPDGATRISLDPEP